ncbi:hypothetical protein [Streptomyces sp. NPDC051211]|uniref:D-alanyl-D-alanine carboxypeptidase family protein n=1 Tax=Streptomyces sp. NPDC051211 TaxID=3154643 RepID=UPI003450FE1D
MEEELVAGESPDKSVEQGSSGAAAASADQERGPKGSAASASPERDPRLSVLRPREAGSEDPLRAAVAAWVATADPADADSEKPSSDGGSAKPSSDAAEPAAANGAKPAADAAEPAPAAADAAPAAPASASASAAPVAKPAGPAPADAGSAEPADDDAEPAAADSERTAVFRAVRTDTPGKGSGSAGEAAADKPGEDAAPAAADAPPAGSASAAPAAKPAASAPAEAGSAKPADDDAESAAADSERTAVFRAVRPTAAAGASASVRTAAADKPAGDAAPAAAGSAKPSSDAAESAAADSERTAVFRAVRPDAPGKGSGSAGTAAADKPADDADPADSERTAVFRAVRPDGAGKGSASGGAAPAAKPKPGSASGGDSGKRDGVLGGMREDSAPATEDSASGPEDSEKTAVFRAVRPGAAAPTAPSSPSTPSDKEWFRPAAPSASGSERSSTFVPLRTDDAPRAKPAPTAPKPAPAAPKPAPRPAVDAVGPERTTQQPLPPRPPLDMLAELTNNPPPPPSAMRTAVRRVKIYAPLLALLAVILGIVQLVRPLPDPKLTMTAKDTFTFSGEKPSLPYPSDGQSYMAAAGLGTVGSSGEQKPVPIASVTKAMTAYIILRDHPLKKGEKGPMIPIDKLAESEGKKDKSDNESTLNTVKEGDQISEYDAIAALMIPSANNIARLLARWDTGGDQEAFVKKMNDTAKELGMTNTTYTDPSGLDSTTVSTAEDQVKLGLKIVEMEALVAITRLPKWTDASGKEWRNWNDLVPFNGSLGIKTGSTTKGGGNLLFAAEKKVGKTNQLIVGAVLGQHKTPILGTAIAASKDMMLATQKMLTGEPVVKKGQVVGYVDDGLGGRTPVAATADVEAVGWPSVTVAIKLGDGGGSLPQSAKAGTEVGMLTVGEGASQVKVPVVLKSDLIAPGIGSKLTRVG